MNFFKSMLSDDPQPENTDDFPPNHQQIETVDYTSSNSTSSGNITGGGGGLWSFGDLVKTLTTKSESVLQTYRCDLNEFGSGLRKESELFRQVASRAVKDLPDVISQSKDGLLEPYDVNESGSSESVRNSRVCYNRFDSQLNAIRTDARTYCDDPKDDLDDYGNWKLGFVLNDWESEIKKLIGDNNNNNNNGFVEAFYEKVVPNEVDEVTFWCRYFYRVQKLRQQEDVRAQFVTRSLTVDDEEELSWDTWDVYDNADNNYINMNSNVPTIDQNHIQCDVVEDNANIKRDVPTVDQNHEQCDVVGDNMNNGDKVPTVDQNYQQCDVVDDNMSNNIDVAIVSMNNVPKIDQNHDYSEKVESVPKADEHYKDYGKDLQEDEDLEWDEIGDVGEDDEKHVVRGETGKKGEFLKRVNIAEDDEDLSWDIEDDDGPVKTSSAK